MVEKIVGKIPPQSIEAEKALICSLMLDKEGLFKVVDSIKDQDFYKNGHSKIYRAMMSLFDKNEPIDLLSVTQKLKEINELEKIGGASYLSEILNSVPTPTNILHYAKIVKEKKILRDLIKSSDEISESAYNEARDIDLILDESEKKIFSISQKSLTQTFLPIKSELNAAFERIDKIHSEKTSTRGVTTGFPKLNNYLSGLQNGDLILLAARPSLGKTSLALDIAREAAKDKVPVGIFSLEMSKEQLVDRMIAAEAKISLWKLRTGKLSEEDFEKIQNALATLSETPIYIDDAASSTVLQMRAMARRLQAEKGLGLIIIDYLQLIYGRSFRDSPVQQVTEISRGLKGLAKELKIPVLALSQLSRAVEQRPGDHRPKLADLRESGSLEQDADVVLFIYREDKYKPDKAEPNVAEVIIAKHRNGPVGKADLYFDQDLVSFKEIERGYEEDEFSQKNNEIESNDII